MKCLPLGFPFRGSVMQEYMTVSSAVQIEAALGRRNGQVLSLLRKSNLFSVGFLTRV